MAIGGDKELEVARSSRDDLFVVFPNEYGGISKNALPGFSSVISLNNYSVGIHTITIELYSRLGELISTTNKTIYVYDNMYFGIDVSSHQGSIDWKSVSKTGLDFAILRLGYGDNWISQDDVRFINNVTGCVENNIPFGVYLYSYAVNLNGPDSINHDSESIDSEIAHTLRLLNSLTANQKLMLKLPVFIDMEDNSTIGVGKLNLTRFADYYCSKISENGYKCGIYANRNWLWNYLDASYLEKKYDIWLADPTNDYGVDSNYNGIYHLWQYSWLGSISGINSNGLDMDVSFKKYW